jgi:dCMP deaminase
MNAILNAHKDLRGSTIYVTLFPCNECAKAIIQAGIKKVIYKDLNPKSKDMNYASSRMLQAAGVEVEKYVPANLSFTFEV